jgi:hypothetical protein
MRPRAAISNGFVCQLPKESDWLVRDLPLARRSTLLLKNLIILLLKPPKVHRRRIPCLILRETPSFSTEGVVAIWLVSEGRLLSLREPHLFSATFLACKDFTLESQGEGSVVFSGFL